MDSKVEVSETKKDKIMAIWPLQLSDKPIVTLPAELARQVGLEAGEVQIVLGEHSLTVVPATPPTDYATRWVVMAATLREQAASFDLSPEDRRDAAYWEIVNPLFEEAERLAGSV
jgi:hypothetical protein